MVVHEEQKLEIGEEQKNENGEIDNISIGSSSESSESDVDLDLDEIDDEDIHIYSDVIDFKSHKLTKLSDKLESSNICESEDEEPIKQA